MEHDEAQAEIDRKSPELPVGARRFESHAADMMEEVRALADAGAYRAAWKRFASLPKNSPEWHELHCLLTWRLGLDVERRLAVRAFKRAHPDSLLAHVFQLFDDVRRVRTWRAFDRWRAGQQPAPQSAREEQWWHLASARMLSELRDFDRAYEAIDRAAAIDECQLIVDIERAWVLFEEDRVDEALAQNQLSRERWPSFGLPLEQQCGFALSAGDGNGLALIERSCQVLEAPHLEAAYAHALFDRGEYTNAKRMVERTLAAQPLGRALKLGLHELLLRISRVEQNLPEALHQASFLNSKRKPWLERLKAVDASAEAQKPTRIAHAVPYVRQDHVSCSPATMASLLQFFGIPIGQREIAEEITYDGTPLHSELVWAEARGYAIQFFLFEAELARDLIDRGLPFAITMLGENWGHRVALCGYDRVLDSFLVRDPNQPLLVEFPNEMLQRYVVHHGGICALLLPAALKDRIPAYLHKEGDLWLKYMRMCHLFEQRRLLEAEALASELTEQSSGHLLRLTHWRLASEHQDARRLLEWTERHLSADPTDAMAQAQRARALKSAGRWNEYRAFLGQVCASADASPMLRLAYAELMLENASEAAKAEAILREVLQRAPMAAEAYRAMGSLLWSDRKRRRESVELLRIASCVSPFAEDMAQAYAEAAIWSGDEAQAFAYLRQRVERYGGRSPQAALTLAQVLRDHGQAHAALEVIEACAERHPQEAHAQRARLEAWMDAGRLAEAQQLMPAVAALLPRVDRELLSARLYRALGDQPATLAAIARAATDVPPRPIAFRAYWMELFLQRGSASARMVVEDIEQKHGDDPLLMMQAIAFYEHVEDIEAQGRLLRRLVEEHPQEPWLRQKLARHLSWMGAVEALAIEVEVLERLTPHATETLVLRANLALQRGDRTLARVIAHEALEREPDGAEVMQICMNLTPDASSANAFLRERIVEWLRQPRSPSPGAFQLWLAHAKENLPLREVHEASEELLAAFPTARELRKAWIRFHLDHSPDAALAYAEAVCSEAPWDDELTILRARCLRELHRAAEARDLMQSLVERKPFEADAYVQLGSCYEEEAQMGAARDVYRRALERVPFSAELWGYLASASWRLGQSDEALYQVARAHELQRGMAWAWERHVQWLAALQRHEDAIAVAREWVASNPRWPQAHQVLASIYELSGRRIEQVEALRQALVVQPRDLEVRLSLAKALIADDCYDEARELALEGQRLLGERDQLALIEAQILRARGSRVEARACLSGLMQRFPASEEIYLLRLSWMEADGRVDDILNALKTFPEALRDSPVLSAYAADAYLQQGKTRLAIEELKRALERNPAYSWARDRLAQVYLGEQAYVEVLQLLGEDPEALPLNLVSYVGQAAAHLRRTELANRCFNHLMTKESFDSHALREMDAVLQEVRGLAHVRTLHACAKGDALEPRINALLLLGARKDRQLFFAGLQRLWNELRPAEGERIVSQLCLHAIAGIGVSHLAPWIAQNIKRSIQDPVSLGRFSVCLGHALGHVATVRLFAPDWKRPGIESWMLANLASALLYLDKLSEAEVVSRYALDQLPRDNGYWWHQRMLAEIALRRGHPDQCLKMLSEPPSLFAGELLRTRVLFVRAKLALERGWWRKRSKLKQLLPRIRQVHAAAKAEGLNSDDCGGREIFAACPCWASFWYLMLT